MEPKRAKPPPPSKRAPPPPDLPPPEPDKVSWVRFRKRAKPARADSIAGADEATCLGMRRVDESADALWAILKADAELADAELAKSLAKATVMAEAKFTPEEVDELINPSRRRGF